MTENVQMQAPNGNAAPEKPKVNRVILDVKIDAERLKRFVTLDEYIAFEDGSARSAKALVSACLWDATNRVYIDYDEAVKLVGRMKLEQATELFERLKEDLGEEAVPKEYEIASGSG